ncbi:hypothetical protein J1614_003240 [Plenodomus biglobosus]|nr:hypothetical protein J1614_003240 [Plenodomus biglobosus]
MAGLSRSMFGFQATFTDGGLPIKISQPEHGKIHITNEVTVEVYGDGVLFHSPITTTFGQRRAILPATGPILQSWKTSSGTKTVPHIPREIVRFARPSDALLVTQRPIFAKTEQITTELLYTIIFRAPKGISSIVNQTVFRILQREKRGRESTFSYRTRTDDVDATTSISIYDVDRHHIANVLKGISGLYSGYTARHDVDSRMFCSAIWHPGFDSEHGRMWIQQFSHRTGTLVLVDAPQQRIRIYGNPMSPWTVLKMDNELNRKYTELTKGTMSNPSSPQDCPVCSETTNSIRLSCGHTYCSDCFYHQIHTATANLTSNEQFPIRCWGSNCEKPISLRDLQLHLPFEKFDTLLQSSLRVYMRNNASKYRHCPQPDCTGMYLASNEDAIRTWPVCLATSVCTACNFPGHPNFTCTQNARPSAGSGIESATAAREWRITEPSGEEFSIKQCPKCNVFTQKGPGCYALHCMCGVHWCWQCSVCFEEEEGQMGALARCYNHMRKIHGGLGADYGKGGVKNLFDMLDGPAILKSAGRYA